MFRSLAKIITLSLVATLLALGGVVYLNHKAQISHVTLADEQSSAALELLRQQGQRQVSEKLSHLQNQIETLAQTTTVIDALAHFKYIFGAYTVEDKWDFDESRLQKSQLIGAYEQTFKEGLKDGTTTDLNHIEYLEQLSTKQISLQHQYIVNNPYKSSNRAAMVRANEFSSYADFHAAYHPTLKEYRERFGIDDIILIDHMSGDIVYTVNKDFDFATNLKDGKPFQNALAQAYGFAKTINKHDRSYFTAFSKYLPAGNREVSFLVTPVWQGRSILGLIAMRINPSQLLPGKFDALPYRLSVTPFPLKRTMQTQGLRFFSGYDAKIDLADLHLQLDTVSTALSGGTSQLTVPGRMYSAKFQVFSGIFLLITALAFVMFFSREPKKSLTSDLAASKPAPKLDDAPLHESSAKSPAEATPKTQPSSESKRPSAPVTPPIERPDTRALAVSRIIRQLTSIIGDIEAQMGAFNKSNKTPPSASILASAAKPFKKVDAALFEAKVLATNLSLESVSFGPEGQRLKYLSEHIHNLIQNSYDGSNELRTLLQNLDSMPTQPTKAPAAALLWKEVNKELAKIQGQLNALAASSNNPPKPDNTTTNETDDSQSTNRFKRPQKPA